jgi:hypothetical protein
MYSHIVYFPPYLSHLPESNKLITGEYGLQEGNFWMMIHPLLILSIITTLMLNWKLPTRRKFVFIAFGIYALAIVVTAIYFVPELKAFAASGESSSLPAADWYHRGQTWQHLSWIRGFSLYVGFIMLLIALLKDRREGSK